MLDGNRFDYNLGQCNNKFVVVEGIEYTKEVVVEWRRQWILGEYLCVIVNGCPVLYSLHNTLYDLYR